ncbi:sigma-70 family RNA polymerase sigma factor [Streptomyces sp. NBC_00390]|uniref:sigma-70 family RNA polymerase sigma factor n=1 Tax=Streptomyces sp. NBC_00390 TaxID=2975736 RepID=UPI003FCC8B31
MALWRRPRGTGEDPLDAALVDRVRAILALGGMAHADLPDGVQQVRLKVMEARAKEGGAPRDTAAWCAVVASNVAADWHRARRRRERLDERLIALRPWETVQRGGEEASALALTVAEGLEALPLEQRQVVVLRFYADLPLARIAEALEIPEGTVKSRLHTAMRVMRKRLRAEEVV